MFPCEYHKIFKNTYFKEHLRRAASVYQLFLPQVAPEIKRRMVMKGSLMIAYQPMNKTMFNVFRMVCSGPRIKPEDLEFVLDEIERLGKDL